MKITSTHSIDKDIDIISYDIVLKPSMSLMYIDTIISITRTNSRLNKIEKILKKINEI
jgi:glycyl-tRNA synthetase alpha subunit